MNNKDFAYEWFDFADNDLNSAKFPHWVGRTGYEKSIRKCWKN